MGCLSLCLNFFSSITADFNISSALRWVIQDHWSSGNGENDVSIFPQLLWIQSSSNLQITRTDIKSLDGFEFRPVLTNHFGALEWWKKWCLQLFSLTFDQIFVRYLSNLQVRRTGIKARMSWNFRRIGLFTLELFALECGIYFPSLISGGRSLPSWAACLCIL